MVPAAFALLHSRPAFGIALPLPASDRRHLGCGCSSVVEHDLAKVGVEGSSPFARSKVFLNIARDLADPCGGRQSYVFGVGDTPGTHAEWGHGAGPIRPLRHCPARETAAATVLRYYYPAAASKVSPDAVFAPRFQTWQLP